MYDDMQPDNMNTMPQGEPDREGAMAKADLYKLANYSLKLFKKLQDDDQLEGWVQAKITKAADYVASVYHYLEYEMKISEYGEQLNNAEMMSESRKAAIQHKLMEAKKTVKALKMAQAEKLKNAEKPKKVEEGMFGGEQKACEACGGSGQMMTPEREIPEELKAKVEKYNRRAKAFTAASHRIDRNKNGIPDDEEVGEGQEDLKKAGDSYKTSTGSTVTKTDKGIRHTRDPKSWSDEDGDEKSGKGKKSHAKSQSAAEKKSQAPKLKQSPKSAKTWGMKDGEKFDNRDKEKEVSEVYGQGVYEGEMTRAGKGVMKYGKDGMKALAKAGKEGKDLEPVKAKYNKYDEATEPKDVPKKGEKMGKEGNAFGKAVRDAKADGVQKGEKIKVGGKEYPVKEASKPDANKNGIPDYAEDGKGKNDLKKGADDKKKSKKVDESADWKAKASTLRDSLESMLAKKSAPVDETLEEMMALAAEIDAEGLAEASKDPAMLDEFLQNVFAVQEEQVEEVADESVEQFTQEASLNESTDFDRMKQFLTRLNG
jgi:hypothetical protein